MKKGLTFFVASKYLEFAAERNLPPIPAPTRCKRAGGLQNPSGRLQNGSRRLRKRSKKRPPGQYWPLDALIPFARNARTKSNEQISQIAASIREFGFTNPILLDGANGIIPGHGRLAAATLLELKTVPCIELGHLSEAQKRAYIIADNKLALNGGWNEDLLRLELTDLKALEANLKLTGFDLMELADITLGKDVEFKDTTNPRLTMSK